ncbi:MAG: EAL domain-containing protein [Gammaproteobacteria bacterium]|nr:EAL domain-containing protein [Gammaproteobacteria bacterium]
MKNFKMKEAYRLSFKKKSLLIVLGAIVALTTLIVSINAQHKSEKRIFDHKLAKITLQQIKTQARDNSLLTSLAQYYTSSAIRSANEFKHFTQGLYDHTENIHAIGFANYLTSRQKPLFDQRQKQSGYESFNTHPKGLFKEEVLQPQTHHLSVSIITPYDSLRSTMLSEDLLSIPQVQAQLGSAILANKPFSVLVQSKITHQFYRLMLQPVYASSPAALSDSARQAQMKGVIFLALEIENAFIQRIQNQFKTEPVYLIPPPHLQSGPLFKSLLWAKNKTESPFLPFEYNMTGVLKLSPDLPDVTITVLQHWGWHNLNITAASQNILLALLGFLILSGIMIALIHYTLYLRFLQNRLEQIFETSQEAIVVTNHLGYIKVWNPAAETLFGYTPKEALSQCFVSICIQSTLHKIPGKVDNEQDLHSIFMEQLQLNSTETMEAHTVEIPLMGRGHKSIIAEVSVSILKTSQRAEDAEISLFIKDISNQRQAEADIKQLAYFDPLTNLENRSYFKSQIDSLITQNRFKQFAILFLDLDGFKQVNDSLGHSIGDELLKVISKRLTLTLRDTAEKNHICRFGGDEFIFMLGGVGEQEVGVITLRLLKQIERLVHIQNDDLQVTGSIGIALYPQHGTDVDTLLRHADSAMYQSKSSGKNTFSIYEQTLDTELSERILIEKHLRHALRLNEFSLVFQPQIDLSTHKTIGVEALIRWHNPVLGFVAPDRFISIAEESNLIVSIGDWVAQTCVQQLKAWKNTPFNALHIAINVSSQQLQQANFMDSLSQLMHQANLPSHLLEIELTERTVMSNAEENIVLFNDIREQGFGLSVDDFGTGYSSLSYLKKFPLSILKIDKSFVDGLPNNEDDVSIARAIVTLSHSLNMRVVAEGVETLEQLDFLTELGCDFVQGYYISRPVDINTLEAWLSTHDNGLDGPPTKAIKRHVSI